MKQAFRIITRMKGYTALSLLGLIISLSGTVIISRYIYQEWTIDHFMPALDRTLRRGVLDQRVPSLHVLHQARAGRILLSACRQCRLYVHAGLSTGSR